MSLSTPTPSTPSPVTNNRRTALRDISFSTNSITRYFGSSAGNITRSVFMTPSPDEQVIQLRGRRICLSASEPQSSPRKGSPKKSPKKSPSKALPLTPTRTSPRKRLQPILLDATPSPRKMIRLSELEPIQWTPPEGNNLKFALQGLSKQQLITLLERAIDFSPELKEEIKNDFPAPDFSPLEENLQRLKKNIFVSFPRSRWGSMRDAFCFRRVSTHVDAFKKDCLFTVRNLVEKSQWLTAVQYVTMAWPVVQDLPDWDNPSHNKAKQMCFRVLASCCLRSLKAGSFNTHQYEQILERLEVFVREDGTDLEPCIKYIKSQVVK